LRDEFVKIYRDRYLRLNPDVPIETVNWRVTVAGPIPRLRLAPPAAGTQAARKGSRRVFFIETGRFIDCAVYDRFALRAGARLRGPAVVEEAESTVVLGPGAKASIDAHGNLLAELPAARQAQPARTAA
jgi:N-methylhydantoinase A